MSWGHWRLGPRASTCCRPPLHASTTLVIHVTWQMRKLGSEKGRTSSRATARGRAGTHPACAPRSPVEAESEAPQLPLESLSPPAQHPCCPRWHVWSFPGVRAASLPPRTQTRGFPDPRGVGSESQARPVPGVCKGPTGGLSLGEASWAPLSQDTDPGRAWGQ